LEITGLEPGASWTALAKRGGDSAFGMATTFPACESGVALRFPPHSKIFLAEINPSFPTTGFRTLTTNRISEPLTLANDECQRN
jgi:hypothetical protein